MAKSAMVATRGKRSGAGVRRPTPSRAKKISITVDERILRAVERDARRAGRTLSSHITEALSRDLRQQRLAAIVEHYEAEHGTITDEELAAVRARWQD
jgi:hypothetical protein